MTHVRDEITPRDLQVAKWIARGMERNDVAVKLATNRPAINRHMAKVMDLTTSRNGIQAVAHLVALGLLNAEDVTGMNKIQRVRMAARIAPEVKPDGGAVVRFSEVAAWLRRQAIAVPNGEAEEHFNECIASMAAEWEVKIPGQRRDPDAPRPPQQPKRDT